MEDQVDQSVETDDTSVVEESGSQPEASEAEQQEAASKETQEEKIGFNDPRHPDHPRFKELIESNKAYKQQFEDFGRREEEYRRSLERLQTQMEMLRQQSAPKQEQPKDPFLKDLEQVNPEYAKSLEAIYQKAGKTEELERRLAQYEQTQFREKVQSRFNSLFEANKVTDEFDREMYERAVKAEIYERENVRGEKLGLEDLDKIFNNYHNRYSKAMEERNRKLTASYVKEKATDKTPKATTGGAPASAGVKKIAAHDTAGQAKWLADQIRQMKKGI